MFVFYIRYKQIDTYQRTCPRRAISRVNKVAFVIGLLAAFGISMVGNFQVMHAVPECLHWITNVFFAVYFIQLDIHIFLNLYWNVLLIIIVKTRQLIYLYHQCVLSSLWFNIDQSANLLTFLFVWVIGSNTLIIWSILWGSKHLDAILKYTYIIALNG